MSDNFGFTLHSTLNKEDLDKLLDVEFENTPSVTFQTPQGRQVRYIKCEVLDKIRAEIEQLPTTKCTETHRIYIDADDFKKNVLVILDKYKAESEE